MFPGRGAERRSGYGSLAGRTTGLLLHARSWSGKLIALPGQTKGMLAYMTDPDGLDNELINQRPATPAQNDRPAQAAFLPGVSHVGQVILDAERCKAFYSGTLGAIWPQAPSPWMQGDFTDSAVGGHAGATIVSGAGIISTRGGRREVMVRDPDTGVFLELFDIGLPEHDAIISG